jgi:hypothetical protein
MELAVLGEVMNIKIKKLKKILIDLKLMMILYPIYCIIMV